MARRQGRGKVIRLSERRRGSPRPSPRARLRPSLTLACAGLFAATLAGGLALPHAAALLSWGAASPESVGVTYVIDGDTLVLAGGERVRLTGIDAAEMPPRAACDREIELALAAKARLMDLVRRADRVELRRQSEDRDRYGRLLRRVLADGRDVGDVLVHEGLAQRWRGRKAAWC